MNIRPIVKYHGGKGRLFKWIVENIPKHDSYCELFGGAASVLMNKCKSDTEVYNDIEPKISNLLKVARDQKDELLENLIKIQYEKETYLKYRDMYFSDKNYNNLEDAVITYVTKRMSRGGLCGTFSWSSRIYSTGPAEIHCWNSSLENLKHCSERLQGVKIFNKCAFEIIPEYDSEETLFYFDPPYVKDTRVSREVYHHEIEDNQHVKLANICKKMKGTAIISGYPSLLYDELFDGWRKVTKPTANHSSHKKVKSKVKECLWINR